MSLVAVKTRSLLSLFLCVSGDEFIASDEYQSFIYMNMIDTRDVVEMHDAHELERYEADQGYVCPFQYVGRDIEIMPFQKCSASLRRSVASALLTTWPDDIHCVTVDEAERYVVDNWKAGDLMYVMKDKQGEFLGCVAVDRKNFFQYISHLYVDQQHRGQGLSLILLQFIECVLKHQHARESRLWCNKSLQSFYEKQGYTIEGSQHGRSIMKKLLRREAEPMGMCDAYGWQSFSML